MSKTLKILAERLQAITAGDSKFTEETIQAILYDWVSKKKSVRLPISSAYVYKFANFKWESDFFYSTTTKKTFEIEIKVDRNDYRRDKQKTKKHSLLKSIYEKGIDGNDYFVPNFLYYCAPENVIRLGEIPEYAGFIEITTEGKVIIQKGAPEITEKPMANFDEVIQRVFHQKIKRAEVTHISFIEKLMMLAPEDMPKGSVKRIIEEYKKSKRV